MCWGVNMTKQDAQTCISNIKTVCTGCGACFNICPTGAINMVENSEGFLYPKIDKDKCTKCNLCIKTCPIVHKKENSNKKTPYCYAVMADDDIRKKSSSGGMFTLAAEYIINKGGYVYGAAYTQDFKVEHIQVNNIADLSKLRGSKYLQSDTKNCFKEIRKILSEGKFVLFTGCPCQVAGLYSYLGKDYDNLISIELLCHGTPSCKIFKKYLDENHNDKNITKIEFRDKSTFWNSTTITIYHDNGVTNCGIYDDYYEQGFHKGLFNRKSCSPCEFAKLPRVADITIADWWGIKDYDSDMDDNLGTSLVLINNEKGARIFSDIKSKMYKVKEIPLSIAKQSPNKTIYRPLKSHEGRDDFFKNIKTLSFNKSVEIGLNKKYDVGIIGLWAENNYGCLLTGYALYRLVQNLGYSAALIKKLRDASVYTPKETSMVERFTKNLNIIEADMSKLSELNNHFDTFLVGSDQVWNHQLCSFKDRFFYLDFTTSDKRKIAYASSLGSNFNVQKGVETKIVQYLLKRFDKISIREDYAIPELKSHIDIDADLVLDPVFVCDKEVYNNLADNSTVNPDKNYIFAYILDPDPKKNEILKYISEKLGKKLYVATDASHNEYKKSKITEGVVLDELEVQDWLKYYKNSDYIITDSFHGTCFSIIFKKQFISVGNISRGVKRFESLLNKFNLTSRMVLSKKDIVNNELLDKYIDYDETYKILDMEKEQSINWLKDALFTPKNSNWNDMDMTRYLLSTLSYPENYYKKKYKFYKFLYKLTLTGKLHKMYKEKMYYWKGKLEDYNRNKDFLIQNYPNLF